MLGDPVRRRILELLANGERASGEISAAIQREFGISQPGVSQHLRVLREHGCATVRADGTRRFYAVDSASLREIDIWLGCFRQFWNQYLNTLAAELAGVREQDGTPLKGQTVRHWTIESGHMNDIISMLDETDRAIGTRRIGAGVVRSVLMRRSYDAPIDEVWNACTDPDRLERYFLSVAGDLRVGGTFQLEGNASGEILRCEPPRLLTVTWVHAGKPADAPADEIELRLSRSTDDKTVLELDTPASMGTRWSESGLAGSQHCMP